MDWITLYIVAGILILPMFIYGLIAQGSTSATFEKYSKITTSAGLTGQEIAEKLLYTANITNVEIANINGNLSDCYDPRHKVIKLSKSTYNNPSVASIGVVAHEVGHAVQDANGSFLFKFRIALVPFVNLISKAYIPAILIGSILSFMFMIPTIGYYICWISVIAYGASLLFYLVTLPLEYDASKKAIVLLKQTEMFNESELKQSKKVLNAAIHTYIAGTLIQLMYFLRFLSYAMIFANHKD